MRKYINCNIIDVLQEILELSKPNETVCGKECDVCLKDTSKQTDNSIKAFAVELKELKNENIFGDIYEVDCEKHYKQVKQDSLTIYKMNLNDLYENKQILLYAKIAANIKLPKYWNHKFSFGFKSVHEFIDDKVNSMKKGNQ